MKAQCIICQELFENDDTQVVSALWCGHTFHSACLNQWLENGRTCPSCRLQVDRKKIIQRLYFDAPEEREDDVDDSRLQNQLDNLRLEVRKAEKLKNDAVRDKEAQIDKIRRLEEQRDRFERDLKQEQSVSSSHLKMLKLYESQQKTLDQEKQECRRIKQKLVTLQSIDTLMNGAESDAADIIASTGESSGAVQSLSRQVAFLKREYEKLKLEKRQLKDHCEKLQMSDRSGGKKVQDLTKKCEILTGQLERSEGDLKLTEKEVDFLKSKNSKLLSKLRALKSSAKLSEKSETKSSEVNTSSSSFRDLLNESSRVHQAFAVSTPKLTQPTSPQGVDLDTTPDLFTSPPLTQSQVKRVEIEPSGSGTQTGDKTSPRLNTQRNKRPLSDDYDEDVENSAKCIKITSAAEKRSQKLKHFKSDSAIKDNNQILNYASLNIFKKHELGARAHNKGSVVQKGFDGLGGHTTHVNAIGNPFKKPSAGSKKSSSKLRGTPSLPKLDGYIVLD